MANLFNFDKYGFAYIILAYFIAFVSVIAFMGGASVSPTGQVVMEENLPKETFGGIIIVIIGFAVALGILIDFSSKK